MTILVATASRHGSTHEIGDEIAQNLREAGHAVERLEIEEESAPGRYDAAIVGSAVYMGKWLTGACRFVERNHKTLNAVPLWLFSSGPIGPDTPALDTKHIEQTLGVTATLEHRIFRGKLDTSVLGFGERLAVQLVRTPDGDFRNWDEVRDWAHEIDAVLDRQEMSSP
jgi:menaquinone-dependent protoporphyrinogen oxidase